MSHPAATMRPMSEYQSYEFLALDEPLDQKTMAVGAKTLAAFLEAEEALDNLGAIPDSSPEARALERCPPCAGDRAPRPFPPPS